MNWRAVFIALLVAVGAVTSAGADGPLPPSMASAGVTQADWNTLQAEIRATAARARVSEQTLAAVAERLGALLAQDGRVDVCQILRELDTLAQRVVDLEARLDDLALHDDIAALTSDARARLAAGDLDGAGAALAQARDLRAERNRELRNRLAHGEIAEAELAASQAEIAFLRGDYRNAAVLYSQAAQLMPEGRSERWSYRYSEGVAWSRAHSDSPRLFAIRAFRAAGDLAPRGGEDWLKIRIALGEALIQNGGAIRVEMPVANEGEEMRASMREAVVVLTEALRLGARSLSASHLGAARMSLSEAHWTLARCGERSQLRLARATARAAERAFLEAGDSWGAERARGLVVELGRRNALSGYCPWSGLLR